MAKQAKKNKDEDFLAVMREQFGRAQDHEQYNREEMDDDIKFSYGGRYQWDERTYNERETNDRPALTINRLKAPIRQVSNDIRINKPSIKVNPVDDKADKDTAKIYDGLIRSIERQSQAQVAYQCAADGAIRAGFGVFEIRNEYEDEDTFEQDIRIKRILNQFTVYFDPNAKEITKEDAEWCFVTDAVTEEAFERRWPDAEMTHFEDDEQRWRIEDNVRIARYYCKKYVDKTIAQTSKGEVFELTQEQIDLNLLPSLDIAKNADGTPKTRKIKSPKVMCYVVSGGAILEGPYEIPGKFIPVIPVYGDELYIDGETKYSGIVRDAKDPQRLYNYWRTTAAETIALQPKVPYLMTATQIKGVKPLWDQANKSNLPYLIYNHDPQAGAPTRPAPPAPPVAMWQESSIASDDIKFTTGIFDAGIGNQGPEQSGRAILARQQKSDVANYVFTDNLSIALNYAGRILVGMIPKVFDTNRIVRTLGIDDSEDLVEINQTLPDGTKVNDITVGKYDVSVNVGPSYQTKRAEAADSMLNFVRYLPNEATKIPDLIAQAMDWPDADVIAERLKKSLPQHLVDQDDDEEQTPAQQAAKQVQAEQYKLDQAMKMAAIETQNAKAGKDRTAAILDIAKAKETLASIDQSELENLFRVLQATGGQNGQT